MYVVGLADIGADNGSDVLGQVCDLELRSLYRSPALVVADVKICYLHDGHGKMGVKNSFPYRLDKLNELDLDDVDDNQEEYLYDFLVVLMLQATMDAF